MFWSIVGRILWARRLVIALVTLCSLAGGLIVVAVTEPEYDATARVMLNVYKPDPITGAVLGKKTIDPYLQTQINLIRDFQVVGPAVEAAGWLDNPDILDAYAQRPAGDQRVLAFWVAQRVIQSMQVSLVDGSNIVAIRFRGASPEVAEVVAGTLRDAYVAATIRQKRESAMDDADRLALRVEKLRAELTDLQARKRSIEMETGVLLAANGSDIDGQRLVALAGPPKVSGQSTEQLLLKPRSSTEMLTRLDLELAQATATLGPNHPRLAELRAGRAILASRAAADDRASGDVAGSVIASERAKQAAFEAQKSKVLDQRQDVLRLRLLQDQINLKAKALEVAAGRVAVFRQFAMTTESGLTPIGDVEASKKPSFPNLPLVLGGTGGIGFVAGVFIALLVEMFNLHVRAPAGLRIAASAPILGTIPPLRATAVAPGRRRFRLRRLKVASA